MPPRASSNDSNTDTDGESSGDLPEDSPDWYQTGTVYARRALIGISIVAVLMILTLIFLIDPAQPPG